MSSDQIWKKAVEEGCARAAPYRLTPPQNAGVGRAGLQRGKQAGSSLDFKDHREYQPGDDLRHIDWGAYARTDRLTLKLYHEEITPHLDLCIDETRSMALPNTRKQEAALALAAFFATASDHAGYSRVFSLVGDHCRPKPDGDRPPVMWSPFQFNHTRDPQTALAVHGFKPGGVRIFISDLLWPGDPKTMVNALSRGASSLLIVQVLAQSDLHPKPGGKVRLEDSETGETHQMILNAAAVKRYQQTLESHNLQWREAARRANAVHTLIQAETFLDDWRFEPEVLHGFLKLRGG